MEPRHLYALADSAETLNDTLLIGQEMSFARMPDLEDYLMLPLEEAMEITRNAESNAILMVFRGKVQKFVEDEDGITYVVFEDNVPYMNLSDNEPARNNKFMVNSETLYFWEL